MEYSESFLQANPDAGWLYKGHHSLQLIPH